MKSSTRSAPPRVATQRTHRRLVLPALAIVLVMTTAGALWGQRQDAHHEATAVILINPLLGSPFSPDGSSDQLVNLETEAHLATSDAVAGLVQERLGVALAGDDPLAGVSVEVPANTQLLAITVADLTADRAAVRAQTFAETYLEERQDRSEAELTERRRQVDDQITRRNKERNATADALTTVKAGTPKALLLAQELAEITSQVGQLRTQRAALGAQPSSPGQIVTPAVAEQRWHLFWTAIGGSLGLLLGLATAGALAFARLRRNPTLHTPAALALALDARDVPLLGRSSAPDTIRTGLLAGCQLRPVVVLLAGVGGAATTSTAYPLADSLARAELEALVVDLGRAPDGDGTDDDSPLAPGLSDLLTGREPPRDLLDAPDTTRPVGPRTLGPGRHPELLDDLVVAPRMHTLVEEFRKRADVVLITGRGLDDPRTRPLLSHVDTVVLTCTAVTRQDLDTAVDQVRRCGRALSGVVRVEPDVRGRRRRGAR